MLLIEAFINQNEQIYFLYGILTNTLACLFNMEHFTKSISICLVYTQLPLVQIDFNN